MALKVLLLRKKIESKKKELEALQAKDGDFSTREAELEAAIAEAETAEDQAAVEELTDAYEADKAAHDAAKESLESEISELEDDLAEEERNQDTKPAKDPAKGQEKTSEKREEKKTMRKRFKIFEGMNVMERHALMEREDVKAYVGEIRAHIREKRALQNVGLTIPTVMLDLLRENVERYSKLYDHVNLQQISGNGRQVIMGVVPEAVWTDCCANLNDLDLGFSDTEVGCWRVGGYFAICNATIEDSDIDLLGVVMDAAGQSIGLAVDKAIVYGPGTRMPFGIVARLAQTEEPSDYPETARPWVDLHTTNIKSIAAGKTGVDLFAEIALASGAAKGKYSRGEKVWVMNETTYTYLMAQAMSINAAGAIVSGVNGRMPVIGGIIEVLEFVPDYVIVGGYMDLYLLAERAGTKFAESEHVKFLQDQTVMKATARYDGKPVIAEAFVAIGVNGVTPTADMTFAGE